MRKKLTIFGLSFALIIGMILVSMGDIPTILPIDIVLNTLLDVNVPDPTDNDAVTWDAATLKWISEAAIAGSLALPDTDASHHLTFVWNEDDLADRTLNFLVSSGNRSINLSGNLTLTGNNTVATWASTGAIEANSGGATGEIGIDFNSISSTKSTICQSDAEGIASSSDLRIGLDETLRTLIICDRGDLDKDFLLAARPKPCLVFVDSDGTWSGSIYEDVTTFVFQGYPSTGGLVKLTAGSGVDLFLNVDLAAGNSFQFKSPANIELTDADAEQAWMYLEPKINQTGIAGYIGLLMDVTETSTGSGTNALMDLRLSTVSKFKVDNSGYINSGTYSGLLADNDTFTTPIPDTWTGIVIVQNTTDTTSGVYHLDGTTLVVVSQNAGFTITQGTNDKINVYIAGNVLTIENCWAAAKTVRVMFIGT